MARVLSALRVPSTVVVAAAGLASAVAHSIWAAGSPWPMKDRAELARVTTGNADMPRALPTAGVAVVCATVALAALRRRHSRLSRGLLGLAAVGLSARGAADSRTTCRALGLPEPGEEFVRLDNAAIRPACLAVGAAAGVLALGGARR